jgi:hypothetical protein
MGEDFKLANSVFLGKTLFFLVYFRFGGLFSAISARSAFQFSRASARKRLFSAIFTFVKLNLRLYERFGVVRTGLVRGRPRGISK